MSRFASATQDSLILGVLCLHVWLAPYTKVEESFNLHAAHDILLHGLSPSALKEVCEKYLLIYEQLRIFPQFDHFTFPGPIPRSFVGSLILSALARPIILASLYFGACLDKPDIQLLGQSSLNQAPSLVLSWTSVRFLLALSNGIGLSLMRRMTSRRFGWLAGWLFTLFTISQYHLPFWAGRTLPNMFALFPGTSSPHIRSSSQSNSSDCGISQPIRLFV
jgi:alpha-1,6-mannosyltransferase